jgi:hypothetical protein
MAIQFFDTEFRKVTDRFNSVYGNQFVFDKNIKGSLVLSITYLGLLAHRIRKNKRKEDIQQFVKRRDIINNYLDYAEQQFASKDRTALKDAARAKVRKVSSNRA